MASVVTTPTFDRSAKRARLSENELDRLIALLEARPDLGDLIQGGGGARKLRFAKEGGGKRGGYRVITFYGGALRPVYLLDVYAKSNKDNLDAAELKTVRELCKSLLAWHRN